MFKKALFSGLLTLYAGNAFSVEEVLPETYKMTVDTAFVDLVSSSLPESVVNLEFIDSSYDANLSLNKDSIVSVSFISEGAAYKNSVGYYSFTDESFSGLQKSSIDFDGNGAISLNELGAVNGVDWGWLFPNASALNNGGQLQAGDTVDITGLSSGQNIGFFLLPNAWNNGSFTGNEEAYFTSDFLNPESWASTTAEGTSLAPSMWNKPSPDAKYGWGDLNMLGYNSDGSFTHTTILSTAVTDDKLILSFEDLRYGGDKDYNDAIFMITASSADAFGNSNIATAPVPALSGGLFGLLGTIGVMMMGGRRRKA